MRVFEEQDYDIIKIWTEKNGQTMPMQQMLPKTGFIEDGVCAGFLYCTDSSVCLLEHIVVNPDIDADLKNKCLNDLIENLIVTAKSMEFDTLVAFTDLGVVIERSKNFDFEVQENKYTMLSKGL